jgi:UDP-N-acetylglucosamine 2-epimerase (non-hydrolysing)
MRILHVVGARPNFIKVAPVFRALSARDGVEQVLVHSGQHYDFNLSDVFFQELKIPAPDENLNVGSGSHAQQTAEIMMRFEPVVLARKPDLVLVYGDVNSTAAAALVCSKLLIQVGHVEAGLRSGDRGMPEEVNRIVTDQLSDILFTPSVDGNENLSREGIASEKVFLVGNVMIDTLVRMLPAARQHVPFEIADGYILVTLHRPSNVDDLPWLTGMIAMLQDVSKRVPVIFPIHPRTRQRLAEAGVRLASDESLRWNEPLPYLDFLALETRAAVVITDSGGIQEETTYLGVPCLTVRENTERPVTCTAGSNRLVGRDLKKIQAGLEDALASTRRATRVPELWDGHAAERIADLIIGKKGHSTPVRPGGLQLA